MRTLAAILLFAAAACQARPDAASQVNIAEKVEQLNHTLVAAANDVREALGLPTQDEALNVITEGVNQLRSRVGEVANDLKQAAEKQQGSASEQLNNFARSLNESIESSATSLNLEGQVHTLLSSLHDIGHKWQEYAERLQPSADETLRNLQSAIADAAEKTKQATSNLQSSIQSAIQKPAN